MKVVCVSASQVPSDTANSIQVMKVCQGLKQAGHEVSLIVPGRADPACTPAALMEHYGLTTPFEVLWLETRVRRLFPWLAVRRARRLGAGALYVWPLQVAALGLRSGLPVLLEMHDYPGGRFGPAWYRRFLEAPGRKRLLVITRALQEGLEARFGPPRRGGDTRLAPDGVDLERYASLPDPQAARRDLGLPSASTVLCTGHLYAGRGADLFLALAEGCPQASFVWVGGRPADVEAWRSRAASRSLANVTFTGFVPNRRIPLYQAAADVLLMPYGRAVATSSGGDTAAVCSPMKMFEYMAAGRAILTSDLPVLREVLDEELAVFCPPEANAAWADALAALLADGERREGLGRRARAEAARYTWQERARRALEGLDA